MNKLLKLSIYLGIILITIIAEITILHFFQIKMQSDWNSHLMRGEMWDLVNQQWIPTK